MIEYMYMIADKMVDKMADKTHKKSKTKETTDPNLNDLEINCDSAIDNLFNITRIDCSNGNLENNDEFNVSIEILKKHRQKITVNT